MGNLATILDLFKKKKENNLKTNVMCLFFYWLVKWIYLEWWHNYYKFTR